MLFLFLKLALVLAPPSRKRARETSWIEDQDEEFIIPGTAPPPMSTPMAAEAAPTPYKVMQALIKSWRAELKVASSKEIRQELAAQHLTNWGYTSSSEISGLPEIMKKFVEYCVRLTPSKRFLEIPELHSLYAYKKSRMSSRYKRGTRRRRTFRRKSYGRRKTYRRRRGPFRKRTFRRPAFRRSFSTRYRRRSYY